MGWIVKSHMAIKMACASGSLTKKNNNNIEETCENFGGVVGHSLILSHNKIGTIASNWSV